MATQEKRRLMKRVEKLPEANKTLPAASGASYHFCIDIENLVLHKMRNQPVGHFSNDWNVIFLILIGLYHRDNFKYKKDNTHNRYQNRKGSGESQARRTKKLGEKCDNNNQCKGDCLTGQLDHERLYGTPLYQRTIFFNKKNEERRQPCDITDTRQPAKNSSGQKRKKSHHVRVQIK